MEVLVASDISENKALPSMPSLFPLSQPSSPNRSSDEDYVGADAELALSTCDEVNQSDPKRDDMLHNLGVENGQTHVPDDVAYNSLPMEECDELVIRAEASPLSEKRKSSSTCHHPPPKKRRKPESFDVPEASEEEPDNHYAEAYFSKVKSMLDDSTFQRFTAILGSVSDEPGSAVSLYRELESLLANFPELVEDFIGLLTPHQALEIGKLQEYKFITRSLAFFKNLEGNHLTRLIHALEQLNTSPNVTPEQIKSAVLPLLKGHGPLADYFLHLLPNEKPPPSSPDDFEDITEPMMLEDGDEEGWDHVRIPEHAERGCLSDCGCRCHAAPTHPFCLACNIRFIKGQAYVQYGKVIRYCKVHFGNMTHDEVLQRFNPALYSKIKRKKKSINKPPHSEPSKALPEFVFQDENALLSRDDVSSKIVTGAFTSPKLEEKNEEEDDYWEEDDVSSGDKSSAGDVFEEADRHSEDTDDNTKFLERLAHPLSPLGSTVEGYYLEGEFGEESRGAAEEGVRKGVVIDVSDVRPNGVNAHVIKFETRPSNGPCVNSAPSRGDSNPNSPLHVIRDATVVFDDDGIEQSQKLDPVMIGDGQDAVLASDASASKGEIEGEKGKISGDSCSEILSIPKKASQAEVESKDGIKRSYPDADGEEVPQQELPGNSAPSDEAIGFVSRMVEEKIDAVKLEDECQNGDPPKSNVESPSADSDIGGDDRNILYVETKTSPIVRTTDESPSTAISPESTTDTVEILTSEELPSEVAGCSGTAKTKDENNPAEDGPTSSGVQEWTMQEDKLILESFLRKNGVDDETIAVKIRESMPRWTVHEIQERFKVLWDLLMKTMN